MKPITAFVMETVPKLNISTFAEAGEYTARAQKGLQTLRKGKEKVSFLGKRKNLVSKTTSKYTGYKSNGPSVIENHSLDSQKPSPAGNPEP